jgi:hypothetical protein
MTDIIQFAVAMGLGLGEIIDLRWADLSDRDRIIIIRNRKHSTEKAGNDQEVPLLGGAWEIIKQQPETSDRIFPVTEGTLSTIFPRACQAFDIADLNSMTYVMRAFRACLEQGYTIEQAALISGIVIGKCWRGTPKSEQKICVGRSTPTNRPKTHPSCIRKLNKRENSCYFENFGSELVALTFIEVASAKYRTLHNLEQ